MKYKEIKVNYIVDSDVFYILKIMEKGKGARMVTIGKSYNELYITGTNITLEKDQHIYIVKVDTSECSVMWFQSYDRLGEDSL